MSDLRETFKKILDQSYDYDDLMKRENIRQSDVNLLREKIQIYKHVPRALYDKQLLVFLVTCKNDIEQTAVLVKRYYKLKKNAPEFFAKRIVDTEKIQKCLKNQYFFTLPDTPDNNFLLFAALQNFDPDEFSFTKSVKTFLMTSEISLLEQGPKPGVTIIIDMKGATAKHCLKANVISLRKLFKFMEKSSPIPVNAVYALNSGSVVNTIMDIIKPIIPSHLMKAIHFYDDKIDWQKFYEECIPKTHLPSDYGGLLESVKELHEKHSKKFLSYKDYFYYEEKQANLEFDNDIDKYADVLSEKL